MHYELYIDVLFLMNFMMDSLLLLTVKKLLKCPVKNGRVFGGSAAGAGLVCLAAAVPLPGAVRLLLCAGAGNVLMIRIGLNVRGKKEFVRAVLTLYAAAFLMGGVLELIRPWVRTGSLFFAAAVAVYYFSMGIWKMLLGFRERQRRICEVVLHIETGKFRFLALADTGNGLTDPISGDPVHVMDPESVRQMWGIEKGEGETLPGKEWERIGWRYIPYRTVGGEGIMPVFRAKEMELCLPGGKDRIRISRPVIGICKERISEQEEYQMILNAAVCEAETGGGSSVSRQSGAAAKVRSMGGCKNGG